MAIKKIAMFSFADINNYGDILFSHIFKAEIEKRIPDISIDFFTPTSKEIEGIKYNGYRRNKIIDNYDALILAGGEVVHLYDNKTWKPIYKKYNLSYDSNNPSDIVWDWIDIKSKFKAWISVGVRSLENISKEKIDSVIRNLDFISVRGILSRKILEAKDFDTYNKKIQVTPDLGWLIPNYIKSSNNYGNHYTKYIEKKTKYLIFQINSINNNEAQLIADQLIAFQNKTKIKVLLLPVVHPWEDIKYLKMIWEKSQCKLRFLNSNLTIYEIADLIIHSEIVICSSLHTAITGLASSVPSAIINKWNGTKLQDFFGLQFRTDFLSDNLEDISFLLNKLLSEKENIAHLYFYSEFIKMRLNQLFDSIIEMMYLHGK